LQHHERVVRPSTQTLGAREQIHQLRIVFRPGLDGPPGEIVKPLEVLTRGSLIRELTAVPPLVAINAGRAGVLNRSGRELK
jgi:hypothetical protein